MTIGCIDDRQLRGDRDPWATREAAEVIHASNMPISELTARDPLPRIDIHTAAGFEGAVRDATLAIAIEYGGALPPGARTPGIIGRLCMRRLRALGVLPVPHQECAADLGAEPVTQDIANAAGNETAWATTKKAYPDLTEEYFVLGARGAGDMLRHRLILPQEEAKRAMEADHNRAPLIPVEHDAGELVIDWREGRSFDTRSAREAGRSTYYANVPNATRVVMGALSDVVPISEKSFHTAMTMRHAILAGHLPPTDNGRVGVQYIA